MSAIQRTYLLGEEWLYYKIYCGIRSSDAILINEINELTSVLISKGLIDKWFFIRYKDPENHLRLRFKLLDTKNLGEVIQEFNNFLKPSLDDGLIWSIQTETYNRELERYGLFTMELSESIFFQQSEIILKMIKKGFDDEIYFIKVMQLVNQFIACFELSNEETLSFLKVRAKTFENEFELDKHARLDINKKYRKLKHLIDKEFSQIVLFKEDLKKLQALIEQVMQRKKDNQLEIKLKGFISSHVHMLVNRAFRDKQRFFEMMVYRFLYQINLAKSIKRI